MYLSYRLWTMRTRLFQKNEIYTVKQQLKNI